MSVAALGQTPSILTPSIKPQPNVLQASVSGGRDSDGDFDHSGPGDTDSSKKVDIKA